MSLFLFVHESDDNIARHHLFDSFEDGKALEAAAVLIKDAGEAAGVLRVVEDGEERGHVGLGCLEAETAVEVRDADPLDGKRCVLRGK